MCVIAVSFFFFRVLHTMFSHLRAHAFARSVTVARSSAVQASSSRRQQARSKQCLIGPAITKLSAGGVAQIGIQALLSREQNASS